MLYRLDTPTGPICDLLGPCLIRSWSIARLTAREHFERTDTPVTITRIGPSGRTSHALTIDRIR